MERIDFLRYKKELGLHVNKYPIKNKFLLARRTDFRELERLDISMYDLYSHLGEYDESNPMYKKTLDTLADQFQLCEYIYSFENNSTYEFKYADLDGIKALLIKKGYEEETSKTLIERISEALKSEIHPNHTEKLEDQPKVRKLVKQPNNNQNN